jgi:hypothetical protein
VTEPNDAAQAATPKETKVNDQPGRYARFRHAATGALAALAAVGLIAGGAALAAGTRHKPHHHAKVASGVPIKTPTSSAQPPANPQPFLNAVEQLVSNGTITTTQGQAVDRQLRQGYFDSSTLTGLTQAQIQAVENAIGNAKQALAK